MTSNDTISERELITRREALLRVTALLGGPFFLYLLRRERRRAGDRR